MRKLNKKGFAITTLIYGLSIMGFMTVVILLSIMSSSRTNTTSLVKSMNDELNNYGKTSITYTSGGTFTVPTGQAGFYKLEAMGTRGYASGLIYLKEGDQVVSTVSSPVSATINGKLIISSGTGSYNGFVLGRGLDSSSLKTTTTSYACLNGQVINYPDTSGTAKFKITKISEKEPEILNAAFNSLGKNNSSASGGNYTVVYRIGSIGNYQFKATDNFSSVPSDAQITAVGITSCSPSVTIHNTNVSGGTTPVRITGNTCQYEYSLYQQNYQNTTTIPTGNYTIALARNDGGDKYTARDSFTLSTSSVNVSKAQYWYCFKTVPNNDRCVSGIVRYNTNYFGRTVGLTYYKGQNQQKWRIEYLSTDASGNKIYRISEIENYKPFELNEQGLSDSEDNKDSIITGNITGTAGPKLITGIFACETAECLNIKNLTSREQLSNFVYTEKNYYYGNDQQQWIFQSVGNGYYKIRTNLSTHNYLNCEIDTPGDIASNKMATNTCYLESDSSKASVFKITKVDM